MPLFGHGDEDTEYNGPFEITRKLGASSKGYEPEARGYRMGGWSYEEALEAMKDSHQNANEHAIRAALDKYYNR